MPVLAMHGIEKRFGPVQALDCVDFEVEHGEIHALLGVNGAGKSTLIKVLSGIYAPDAGTVTIAGRRHEINSPSDAIRAGVAAVQQHPELVADLTGYENIFLGQENERRGLFSPLDRRSMQRRAEELLERLPLDIDLSKNISQLGSVEKEIIAVLHALKQEHIKILILDEPTSTLTRVEKVQLFKMMDALRKTGVAIIYITHRLEEVFEIADRFTVFRNGKNITTMSVDDAKNSDISISTLMLSEELGELYPPKHGASDQKPQLEINALTLKGVFEDVSFSASPGEIVGLFGLVGSGIEELAKTIFGALTADSGTVELHGKPVRFSAPKQALRSGVFLVPGDRRQEGLVMTEFVNFNTTLASLDKASWASSFLRFVQNRRAVRELADRVDLQPPQINRPASAFSGGNQQKIVIAKGLFSKADVYVFVEPTIGVDVGAKAKLYALIRELSQTATVIVMSSDCDEVFGVADRVGAMYRGTLVLAPSEHHARDTVLAHGVMGQAA